MLITEKEMARSYYTLELLRSHSEVANYLKWAKDKPVRGAMKFRPYRRKR
jgi:hypothetical protein